MRPHGRKPASAQQKARHGNPARAFGAISVNIRFWKILVTRVKRFFGNRLSAEKVETFGNAAAADARVRCAQHAARICAAIGGCAHCRNSARR
jgi:hypothetical protein